ncbi:DUF2752 domain-containing protein [Arenibacter sp. H213]|uniref:DUF2752 domain-containing protein n=1 Tax=Arenibacter antarcticus TaxID=2040469 RepID=A0ABW5VKZ6_9FLAO|nr:DUF2752 domain-containing protein [Arenibacter sp. H213]
MGVLITGIVLLYYFMDPSSSPYFLKCPFYHITGYYCTGCGSQRALHNLLHLDIAGVMRHNALFIPALLLIAYHWTIKYFPFKNSKKYPDIVYHPKTPVIVFLIVVLFTIFRNIPLFPFSLLAPAG